uniref:Eukaryotic translation initiation factor 6 n=1 Tax=Dermatophagoides pteronyssinus TaxID=6956 RepID=A0A6P6XY11_DERPT|nr:eukaryotic translation initiation factor 6-like [Dermatophagoides pteronyssinus]
MPTIWFNEIPATAWRCVSLPRVAAGVRHESSSEIGVYGLLTNSYCLVAQGPNENFYSVFEAELGAAMPITKTLINGTCCIGSCCVGNRYGLLVPDTISDQEYLNIRNALPDEIVVKKVTDRLNAFGNTISCNDYVALCHMELDKETLEILEDVLQVEAFKESIGAEQLVGQYCKFNNIGGVVTPKASDAQLESLSQLLEIPLTRGTVNQGSDKLASSILVNDFALFVGADSLFAEVRTLENIFVLKETQAYEV